MIDPLSECDEEAAPAAGEPRIGGDDASGMRAIEAGELEGRYLAASSFRVKPEGHVNYEELTELAHARYRILRDLRRKDTFLVLPERYSITRIEADEPRAYEGAIHCCSTQESNFSEGGSFRLTARVMPTLTRVERYQMMERLRRVAHPQPKIEYPSEVECGVTCHFRAPGSDPKALVYGARATRDGAGFRVTLTTSAAEAKPLQDQLTSAGIFVDMHFEMEDRTILVSQIEIHPKKSIGPWLCGPLEERREGDSVVLTNRIDQPLWIWEVLVGTPTTTTKIYAVGERLAPGDSMRVPGVDPCQVILPVYEQRIEREAAVFSQSVRESRSVVFVNSANLPALGARFLLIESRIEGAHEAPSVSLSEREPVFELEYLLPAQQDLDEVILEFRVSAYSAEGEIEGGHWQQRRLLGCGNIIEVATSTITA